MSCVEIIQINNGEVIRARAMIQPAGGRNDLQRGDRSSMDTCAAAHAAKRRYCSSAAASWSAFRPLEAVVRSALSPFLSLPAVI